MATPGEKLAAGAPLVVDYVIAVCRGCAGRRTFYPDRTLHGAQELIDWFKTQLTPCTCGATLCDLMCHLPEMQDTGMPA